MNKPNDQSVEPTTIEVLYFADCPNHPPAVALVGAVAAELGANVSIKEVEVTSEDDAVVLRFLGSPTILIGGLDVEPVARQRSDFGFCCRTYPGGSGTPSRQMIRSAIKQAVTGPANSPLLGVPVIRSNWKQTLLGAPAAASALLPAVACPACWPAYANVLAAMGVGFLINNKYLMPITAVLLVVALGALGWRASQRRGQGPLVLGLIAAAVLLVGKFTFNLPSASYAGAALLITASVWNAWPRKTKRQGSCSACVPAETMPFSK